MSIGRTVNYFLIYTLLRFLCIWPGESVKSLALSLRDC